MTITLSPSQARVVEHQDGALLVLAGPGAGKTRVLTERIRRLLAETGGHFRILALTFTNKAANEMTKRLVDVPGISERAFIGTMHSFCTEVLANRGKTVGVDGLPNVFESFQDRRQILSDAIKGDPEMVRILTQAGGAREQQALLGRWLQSISEHKMALRVPAAVDDELERRIYELYSAGLAASSGVDFDDILLLAYRVFEETPKIASFYRRQYRYICVDEAQDLNEAQYRILCALCGDEHRNVLMVGDPKQAIYVFNGADPKYMQVFQRDFKAEVVELNDNYRSSRAVVAAAKALNPKYSVEGQLPIQGEVSCYEASDEEDEARYVLDSIAQLHEKGHRDIEGPVTLERCAVLGRNRFVFSALEGRLKTSGVKYHKKLSAGSYDPSSNMVEEFGLALRILGNPHDRLHTNLLAQSWGVGKDANAILAKLPAVDRTGVDVLSSIKADAQSGSADTIIKAIGAVGDTQSDVSLLGGLAILEAASKALDDEARAEVAYDIGVWREHWDQFIRATAKGGRSLRLFLSHFALGTTEQANREGLALLSVHSAKGMEFDVVCIIGLSQGTFPDYRATSQSQMAEEDRNAFVAVTRSRRLLYASYPSSKMMPWGEPKSQRASKYYASIKSASERR